MRLLFKRVLFNIDVNRAVGMEGNPLRRKRRVDERRYRVLAASDKQLTVQDSEKYPQFMKYDSSENTLSPVTPELLKPTVVEYIFAFLSKLVSLSAKIFFGIIQ